MGKFADWLFMRETDTDTGTGNESTTTQNVVGEITTNNTVDDVLLQALLNGEAITREKALTLPAVSGAVDFICNTVASMPIKLYKYKNGKVEEQEKDTREKLLNGDTGDTLDAFQMKKAMVEDYLLGKGGYCYIERDRNNVTALRYVEDIYITVMKNYKPIFKEFVILVEGEEYKPWDFVKLLRNTKDGASGVGLTKEVGQALETAYRTLLYQLNMVATGGNKKGFLKSQRKLGQEEINVLKQAWNNLYSSSTENVVVLNNGLEFQEASNTSVEMQLNESKKTLMDEVNKIFHIYPDDFDRTFKEAIYPVIRAFETALNRDLLLENEKKNMFFELDPKEILRMNQRERFEAYKIAKETGFATLNEIRRWENMEYIEGLDVVNVGLGAVLYDTNTHSYYTPNTDTTALADTQKMLEGHVLTEEFDADGNSSARAYYRYNPNHDSKNGQFAPGHGGGSKGGSSGSNGEGGSGGSESQKAAESYEKGIRDKKTESFAAFDKNGNKVFEKDGGESEVKLTDGDRAKLKDATATHNHPNGSRFSDEDINTFVVTDMAELRVVTSDGRTCSIKKEGKEQRGKDLFDAYRRVTIDNSDDYMNYVEKKIEKDGLDPLGETAGKQSWDEYTEGARREYSANWLKENAGKYGYSYSEKHK